MRRVYLLLALAFASGWSGLASAATDRVDLEIKELNNSGHYGSATLTPGANNTTTVTVLLHESEETEEHDEEEPYPQHLHRGTCSGTKNTITYPLQDAVVDRPSVTVVPVPMDELVKQSFYINVHEGSSYGGDSVVACGEVVRTAAETAVPEQVPSTGAGGDASAAYPGYALLAFCALVLGAGLTRRIRRA